MLYSTGVPFPFKTEFVCKVADAQQGGKALHVAFGPYRVNPKREFFHINPELVLLPLPSSSAALYRLRVD